MNQNYYQQNYPPSFPPNYNPNFPQGQFPRANQTPKSVIHPIKAIQRILLLGFLIILGIFILYFVYTRITGIPFSFCIDLNTSNNLCFSAVSKQQARTLTQTTNPNFGNLYKQEQDQKNEITSLWEQQAAINDDMVLLQLELNNLIKENLNLATNSIRFIDGRSELLSDIKKEDFEKQKKELETKIQEIEKKIAQNSEKKQQAEDRIRELYVQSGQTPNNRFNPK
jgi:hypothetical protein